MPPTADPFARRPSALPPLLLLLSGCVGRAEDAATAAPQAITVGPTTTLELQPPNNDLGLMNPVWRFVPTPTGAVVVTRSLLGREGYFLLTQQRDASGAPVGAIRGLPMTHGAVGGWWGASWAGGVLLVWMTSHEDPLRGLFTDLLALRLDLAGRPLDAAPIALFSTTNPFDTREPQVTCGATQCLVSFGVRSRGAAGPTGELHVRVGTDGRLLDATPRPSFPATAMASLGDRHFLAWEETRPGSVPDVYVARVEADGTSPDGTGRLVATVGGERRNPLLATDGTRLALAFRATASGPRIAGTYVLLLDRDLNPLAPAAGAPDYAANVLAWNGAGWSLVSDLSAPTTWRFSAAGASLDAAARPLAMPATERTPQPTYVGNGAVFVPWQPGGLYRYGVDGALQAGPLALPTRYPYQRRPRADSDGNEFVVGWEVGGMQFVADTLRVTRVSAAGVVRDTPARRPTYAYASALALEGGAVRVLGFRGGVGAGHAAYDFATSAETPWDRVDPGTGRSIVARSPTQRIVFYANDNENGGGVAGPALAVRYDASWNRLDPAPITLAATHGLAADFDGTNYLYAYPILQPGGSQAAVRRINLAGDFVEVTPRVLTSFGLMAAGPALAFGGGAHLLAWIDAAQAVKAVRLGLDGAPLSATPLVLGASAGAPIAVGADRGREVACVFDGLSFVVVWTNAADRVLRAARVSTTGVVLDPTPTVVAADAPPYRVEARFAAASNGRGDTLVAYEAVDLERGAPVIRTTLLRGDGTAPDAGADAAIDAAREAGVDAAPDALPDVVAVPDVPRDLGVDAAPDALPDAAPDALPDAAPDVAEDRAPPADAADDVASPADAGADVAPPLDAEDDVAAPTDARADAAEDVRDAATDARRDAPADDANAMADAPDDTAAPADAAPDASAPPPAQDDGGCAVRPARASSTGGYGSLALVALAAGLRRRRAVGLPAR
ncbi:MAG: hypothetical protein U0324_26140 [Polyangiales bacterium]